jgi:hypothetical protein
MKTNFVVRFDVLRAVVVKSPIFYDTRLCSPLKVNRRFGRIYCLHLQRRRISQARSQSEAVLNIWFTVLSFLANSSTLKTETCSSESSVGSQGTKWRHVTEHMTLILFLFRKPAVSEVTFRTTTKVSLHLIIFFPWFSILFNSSATELISRQAGVSKSTRFPVAQLNSSS